MAHNLQFCFCCTFVCECWSTDGLNCDPTLGSVAPPRAPGRSSSLTSARHRNASLVLGNSQEVTRGFIDNLWICPVPQLNTMSIMFTDRKIAWSWLEMPTVLVVDDDPTHYILSEVLAAIGCSTVTARNGIEALE